MSDNISGQAYVLTNVTARHRWRKNFRVTIDKNVDTHLFEK